MYADLFREDKKPRLNNPTYLSGNVFSTFIYPNSSVTEQNKIQYNASGRYEPTKIGADPYNNVYKNNPQDAAGKKKSNRRSQSNLSSYGSNSLTSLKYGQALSGREVQHSQQKKYDIINLYPFHKNNSKNQIANSLEIQKKLSLTPKLEHNDKEPISNEVQKRPFDPNGYSGITTKDQNVYTERQNRKKYRPFYLNNADEIYL